VGNKEELQCKGHVKYNVLFLEKKILQKTMTIKIRGGTTEHGKRSPYKKK
jgi:hypothetical protein